MVTEGAGGGSGNGAGSRDGPAELDSVGAGVKSGATGDFGALSTCALDEHSGRASYELSGSSSDDRA